MPSQAQVRVLLDAPLLNSYPQLDIPFQLLDLSAINDSLWADEVRVFENGIRILPVEVDCGNTGSTPPITFFFLMDVSRSMAFIEGTADIDPDSVKWRTAKRVFIDAFKQLRSSDEAALASFAADFALEQNFTIQKKLLEDAVEGMYLRSGTAIYDALVVASRMLEHKEGRRVIILLTDGVDNMSRHTLQQAVQSVVDASIPVYVIALGSYPDERNPYRVDRDTIQQIANGTGGTAYFSPTSEELASIFQNMITSIYSVSCVIRYTSQDTCRDGRTRLVNVEVMVSGQTFRSSFTYTVPDELSRLDLRISLPEKMEHERIYSIPITAAGELYPDQALTGVLELDFDPEVFEYLGMIGPPGLLDPQYITDRLLAPGELRFEFTDVLPEMGLSTGAPATLFHLRLRVLQRNNVMDVPVRLSVESMKQDCDVIATAFNASTTILGCPADITLAFEPTPVFSAGKDFVLPVYIHSGLDPKLSYSISFTLEYGTSLAYLGFSLEGTILEGAEVVSTVQPAAVFFDVRGEQPVAGSGVFMYLHFNAAELKESAKQGVSLRFVDIQQSAGDFICTPGVTVEGESLWIDGICAPLVRRSAGNIQSVHPMPLLPGANVLRITYSLDEEESAEFMILDQFGRRAAVISPSIRSASGVQRLEWNIGNLPSGTYLLVFRQAATIDSKKIMILR